MNNPFMQMMFQMMNSQNPVQMMQAFAGQNNPAGQMMAQAMRMFHNCNSQQDFETCCRNIAQQKGIDLGQAQQMFQSMMPKR